MCNPWMKFYPSDWRSDTALQTCSLAARGLWMEMLCIMHEAAGELVINGRAVTAKQLASLCGVHLTVVKTALKQLQNAQIFSINEDGLIYSRRIKRDIEKAAQDVENGRKGGNPSLKKASKWVNPKVNGGDNGGDKAQKPEARERELPALSRSGNYEPSSTSSAREADGVAAAADAAAPPPIDF